jgi:hypothetical protein
MRAIYDARLADDPVMRERISSCIQDGEEARVLPGVPMKMKQKGC